MEVWLPRCASADERCAMLRDGECRSSASPVRDQKARGGGSSASPSLCVGQTSPLAVVVMLRVLVVTKGHLCVVRQCPVTARAVAPTFAFRFER